MNRVETVPRQIKRWACHKLECFTAYIDAYTVNLANSYYLELYAGGGQCLCNRTDCCIDDASLRALKVKFARYVFVAGDAQDAESLRRLAAARNGDNVEIITGNCNRMDIIRRSLDLIPRSASSFAFIDPPGYRMLRWRTIQRLATHGSDWKGNKMDLLIVFPVEMALLRNLTRPDCQASITRLYGSQEWQEIREAKLAGRIGLDTVRHRLVGLFRDRLKGLGYRHVNVAVPMAFSRSPFYHLIWASDRDSGTGMLAEAWGKPRYLPCELLYKGQ